MDKKSRNTKEYDAKKFLYFDFKNPNDVMLYELLSKAPKRTNKLLAIMAKEFMDNFGITQDISKEELIQIIKMYEIVKNMKTKQIMYQPSGVPIFSPEDVKVQEVVSFDTDSIKQEIQKSDEEQETTLKRENMDDSNDFNDDYYDDLESALSGFNM